MFEFHFTCEVICADGKMHWTKKLGYFANRDLFYRMIEKWNNLQQKGPNGGFYHYFEGANDYFINRDQLQLDKDYYFVKRTWLWFSPQTSDPQNFAADAGTRLSDY